MTGGTDQQRDLLDANADGDPNPHHTGDEQREGLGRADTEHAERVQTDVDSDGVLDSDQKGHLDAEHPTNPISPKRIKNATKIVKSIEVVLRARAKRWTADWY